MPSNKTTTTLSKTPTPAAPSRFRQLLASFALHEAIDWLREQLDSILESFA